MSPPLQPNFGVCLKVLGHRAQQRMSQLPFRTHLNEDGTAWLETYRADDSYLMRFPAIADFSVQTTGSGLLPGSGVEERVDCWVANETALGTIDHLFHSQVVPLIWSRKRCLVLHASAVRVGGVCVAFVGASGMGKSTLATSFVLQQNPLVADDGLRVVEQLGVPYGLPSSPQVRLWRDSQTRLVESTWPASRHVHYTEKLKCEIVDESAICRDPLPIHSVFLLSRSSVVSIVPVTGASALLALTQNTFLLDADDPEVVTNHFDWVSRLAVSGIVARLGYPRDYRDLPRVHEIVSKHVSNNT